MTSMDTQYELPININGFAIALRERDANLVAIQVDASKQGYSVLMRLKDKPNICYRLCTQRCETRHFRSLHTLIKLMQKHHINSLYLSNLHQADCANKENVL